MTVMPLPTDRNLLVLCMCMQVKFQGQHLNLMEGKKAVDQYPILSSVYHLLFNFLDNVIWTSKNPVQHRAKYFCLYFSL